MFHCLLNLNQVTKLPLRIVLSFVKLKQLKLKQLKLKQLKLKQLKLNLNCELFHRLLNLII
jgi:hypothetical protein